MCLKLFELFEKLHINYTTVNLISKYDNIYNLKINFGNGFSKMPQTKKFNRSLTDVFLMTSRRYKSEDKARKLEM